MKEHRYKTKLDKLYERRNHLLDRYRKVTKTIDEESDIITKKIRAVEQKTDYQNDLNSIGKRRSFRELNYNKYYSYEKKDKFMIVKVISTYNDKPMSFENIFYNAERDYWMWRVHIKDLLSQGKEGTISNEVFDALWSSQFKMGSSKNVR